jgi:hypothetical protein
VAATKTNPSGDPKLLEVISSCFRYDQGSPTAVNSIDGSKGNKQGKQLVLSIDTVQAESDVVCDGHGIFPTVDKVGKHVPGIVVSAKTLKSTPDAWQGREESEETRVAGVTLRGIVPIICV